jgi:hypothetical protein
MDSEDTFGRCSGQAGRTPWAAGWETAITLFQGKDAQEASEVTGATGCDKDCLPITVLLATTKLFHHQRFWNVGSPLRAIPASCAVCHLAHVRSSQSDNLGLRQTKSECIRDSPRRHDLWSKNPSIDIHLRSNRRLAELILYGPTIAADNHIVRTARNRVLPSATRS